MATDKVYQVSTRVLAMPRGASKQKQIEYSLLRRRRHKSKWIAPDDAFMFLAMHFTVYSFRRNSFNAEACIEIPVKGGFDYFTISAGGQTERAALRSVIERIEASNWFHVFKANKVYFKVTGAGMEDVYRGYL